MRFATTTLFSCVVALLALGMVMLFSASTGQPPARYLMWQPVWCALGLLACGVCALGDYRWLKKFSWALLALAVALLVLVLVPGIGRHINGARRWLELGGFRFQPSELAKLALLVALAHYGDHFQRQMPTLKRGLLLPLALIAPVLALVFLEPDVGTAVLIAAVSGVVLFIAGTRLRYLAPPVLGAALGLAVYILHNPVRLRRVLAFLYPEENKEGAGYQVHQAIIALGSGGLTGVGLGDGRQKLGFVPEHHTDFIFSVIGEELGLVATLFVLLAFLIILVCGVVIAWNARDQFGLLLGAGVTFLIGFQAAINVGVVTGSLPNKGLSLPFISYGGSNLVLMLACVGLLFNIARHAHDETGVPAVADEEQPA
jgi:cell division protein FtsW